MELALGRVRVSVAIDQHTRERSLYADNLSCLEDIERAYQRELLWHQLNCDRERLVGNRLLRGEWRP